MPQFKANIRMINS